MVRFLVLAAVLALFAMFMNARLERFAEGFDGLEMRLGEFGRGMVATKDFKEGDLVEVCPMLVGSGKDFGKVVDDYLFQLSDENRSTLPLGYCAVYNHSKDPNVTYNIDEQANTMTMRATRTIKKGEHMYIDYGKGYWKSRSIKPVKT